MAEQFYLETGSTDPYYNLAFEEYILTRKKDADYLILWQNDRTVVVGRNQITAAEINTAFVEEHGIRVVRRNTGGGAVYHDLGNLNYSFITDYDPENKDGFRRFTEPVAAALRALGVPAEVSGRNDILAGGRKVSGTAQHVAGGRILHHGTLLFDSDPSVIAEALRTDPLKFQGKGCRSVRARVGNIRPFLRTDMTITEFRGYLRAALAEEGLRDGALSEDDLEEIRSLKRDKYDTWEWNYGRSPEAQIHGKKKWDGGILEVFIDLKEDRIQNISFHGDFLAQKSPEEACKALTGLRFAAGPVREALRKLELPACFGSLREEEILQTIFF